MGYRWIFVVVSVVFVGLCASEDDLSEDWPWVGVYDLPKNDWCYECGGCITYVEIRPGNEPHEYQLFIEFMEHKGDGVFEGPYTMFVLNWPEIDGEIISGGDVPGWIIRYKEDIDILEVEVRNMLFDVDAICSTWLKPHTDWPLTGNFGITDHELSTLYNNCDGIVSWVEIVPREDPYHYDLWFEVRGNSGSKGWTEPNLLHIENIEEIDGAVRSLDDDWSFHEHNRVLKLDVSAKMFEYEICNSDLQRFDTPCDFEFAEKCIKEIENCESRSRCFDGLAYYNEPYSECGDSVAECWANARLPSDHPDYKMFAKMFECRLSLDVCEKDVKDDFPSHSDVKSNESKLTSTQSNSSYTGIIFGGAIFVFLAAGGYAINKRRRRMYDHIETVESEINGNVNNNYEDSLNSLEEFPTAQCKSDETDKLLERSFRS